MTTWLSIAAWGLLAAVAVAGARAGGDDAEPLVGDRVCLIGNVNCALLQTGTEAQVVEDVRRALRQGMPGGGYVVPLKAGANRAERQSLAPCSERARARQARATGR